VSTHGREIRIVLADGYAHPSLRDIHSQLRRWFEAHGARVVSTTSGAVCGICWGAGYTIPDGQGCVVTEKTACAECGGSGHPVARGLGATGD
jgi:DnaJ-class molecular chaperone